MKQLTNVLTQKGLLKTEVSRQIKAQGIEKLKELGFEVMPNGRLALAVAEADGKVVTFNVDIAVGVDTNFEKKEKAPRAAKEAEPTVLPDLFD